MAGGKGERLHPLTRDRSKPSVPFGGRYRIVDFVLSNFVNSEMAALYVLVQYKSQSLIEHLRQAWRTSGILPDYFITVVPPQMRFGPAWYRGTADAVLQNLNVVDDFNPDVVAIFGADHIYRMDINQMLAFHEESGADVTVAARPVPRAEATPFGILEIDRSGRVVAFEEKPARPKGMPNDPEHSLVSMGNYLFSRQALTDALLADARRSTDHDFGRSIIPELVPTGRVYAYDVQSNEVPGVKPYEEHAYWRDVGTVQAYWDAHMDLLGESPAFDLDNRWWPIRTGQHPGPAARFIGGEVDNAHVAPVGVLLVGLHARHLVGLDVVGVHAPGRHHLGDDRAAEVVVGAAPRIGQQHVHQGLPREEIVAHRHQGPVGIVRHPLGPGGLLLEGHDAPTAVGLQHTELAGLRARRRPGRHRDVRARLLVERQQVVDVHPVDVVGAEDRHDVRVEVVHDVEVLQHGVGGAAIPGGPEAHLGRHHGDEVVGQDPRGAPGLPQVLDERLRLVLHEHVERGHLRVDEVGEDEVDDAITAPEGHGRLGAVAGEGMQPLALAAGHDHAEHTRAPSHYCSECREAGSQRGWPVLGGLRLRCSHQFFRADPFQGPRLLDPSFL